MEETECIICGKKDIGYGNNPSPLINEGRCCDECNLEFVILYRFIQSKPLTIEDVIDRTHLLGRIEGKLIKIQQKKEQTKINK